MIFVANASDVARDAMNDIDQALTEKYVAVVSFLASHPDTALAKRGSSAPAIGSVEYIKKQAVAFAQSRSSRAPKPPQTIPDEMVSVILVSYFDISQADTERVKREHSLSMAAENLIGELLERYLAYIMEPKGWIWCSGTMVRAVDFIKPPSSLEPTWRQLQVKNRDNSENSSSSAIRVGTKIEKWHRTFSKKAGSNWDAFPDASIRSEVSEEGFKQYVKNYLRDLRQCRK